MATELKHTVKPSGGDYTTLDAAIDHLVASHANLVGSDNYATVEIGGDWSGSPDTAAVTINGLTTDATRYLSIVTDASNRPTGKWDTTKYRLEVANNSMIVIADDYVRIDGLQGRVSSGNANYQVPFDVGSLSSGANQIRISNCIWRGHGADYNQTVLQGLGNGIFKIWNCIIYGLHPTNTNSRIFTFDFAGTAELYSVTGIGSYIGLNRVSGTVTAKNCYFGNGSGADYNGTISMTTCASSDSTGSLGLRTIAVNTTNFTAVSAGSEDFRLPGTGSALYNVGTDTSGDTAPLNFTTDIAGESRSTWDIGADEYVAAGGTTLTVNVYDLLNQTEALD